MDDGGAIVGREDDGEQTRLVAEFCWHVESELDRRIFSAAAGKTSATRYVMARSGQRSCDLILGRWFFLVLFCRRSSVAATTISCAVSSSTPSSRGRGGDRVGRRCSKKKISVVGDQTTQRAHGIRTLVPGQEIKRTKSAHDVVGVFGGSTRRNRVWRFLSRNRGGWLR